MELRRRTKKRDADEYAELKLTLTGLGFYEEDMQLAEMRQILQALQMSETDFEKDCQQTELSFMNTDNVLNSTMINNRPIPYVAIESPSSSPEPHYEMLTVHASVHHSLNWSPTTGSINLREINNDINVTPLVRKRFTEESGSTTTKRLCLNSIENAPDSGINLSYATSSSPLPICEENWDEDHIDILMRSSLPMPSQSYDTEGDVSVPETDSNWDIVPDENV